MGMSALKLSPNITVDMDAQSIPQGYKRTEIGVIPEDWEVCRLDSLGTRSFPSIKAGPFGSSLTKSTYVATGYKVYGQEQVIRGDYLYGDYYISFSKYRELESCAVNSGDILLSLVGTTGKLLVITDNAPAGVINPRLIRFSFDKKRVDSYFFRYLFESNQFQNFLAKFAQGGTMDVLNAGMLKPIKIPLPSLPEQQAIAEVLSDVDALIESLEKLIAKKRAVKQATMQQLLTGKTRLPGFSGEWEMKKLGDIANFFKGKGLSKSEIADNGKTPCIHYGELFTVYKECIKDTVSYTDKNSNVFLSKTNDVLMPTSDVTPRGLATASCLKKDGVIIGGDVLVIRTPSEVLNGVFLSYCVTLEKTQILSLVTGSTVYHLYASDMKKFEFACPPTIEGQTAIAAILSDMDTELATLEQRLGKSKQIKQGMMQQLLTGKVRLVSPHKTETPV